MDVWAKPCSQGPSTAHDPAESRRELHALFPDMDMGTTPVRPHLRGRPLDKVIARHQDHSRDFTH